MPRGLAAETLGPLPAGLCTPDLSFSICPPLLFHSPLFSFRLGCLPFQLFAQSWALFAEPLFIFILPGIFSAAPLGF